ncbi:MAG TPA: bifunctional N(6)-L-threonylcarbamoyladenine synthase/serine/threonine protein kinase [Methanomicrobiales archaeon]|nr:bifunctional N(6)-L-threonylcarbamoyladenine synthase/serine/threonine protein kinase [Methanomicrobiales archaeon]
MQKGPVLGIEGTAWNLSASVFDEDLLTLSSHAYQPPQGGIHPREAAQHHARVMKEVVTRALEGAPPVTAVAFSQGPGLGPCLRTTATAARALALGLGVPLVGVNHCVAHVEIGRFATGFDDPIVLYVSGANTQVLGFLNRRYRIFGETLDIGLGNALDKFARSRSLPHPGGPAIEALAAKGEPLALPYTVKGMDLAFSGIVSAAKDVKAPIEDTCAGLQETAFAMCVEVTERALAHAGKEEVILVGGVGANRRLQEMVRIMCEERGARFAVPEQRYLGDNGAMIAFTGRLMLGSGRSLPVEESMIIPGYRADDVEVTWRSPGEGMIIRHHLREDGTEEARGAEAVVTIREDSVEKRRCSKRYRVPSLDIRLIAERTRAEARIISQARRNGVPTPIIRDVTGDTLVMERIAGPLLKEVLTPGNVREAGRMVGRLHTAGIIHGDLTTSNIIVRDGRCVLIDFGLSLVSSEIENRGVDLHVFFQTLESTTTDHQALRDAFIGGYGEEFPEFAEVLAREQEIEHRGRYL